MTSSPSTYIGIMTGNSMDAADAVLVEFDERCQILAKASEPIQKSLSAVMWQFAESNKIDTIEFLQAQNELTKTCARAIKRLNVDAKQVIAIGCHGQTIAHRPQMGATWQMLNGALLAELSGIDVICDFRSRDVAAGGEGAPMAPAFHHYLFASAAPCDVVNIGGITNITHVRPDEGGGYDLGPGMLLSDSWYQQQQGGRFDPDGQFAASGKPCDELLQQLLQHPFFSRPPPKSCGREEFSLSHLPPLGETPPADVQATFIELTAHLICQAISAPLVYLCGGGARNKYLVQRLNALCKATIQQTDEMGLSVEYVEPTLCAWLAKLHIDRQPLRIANSARIAGAHYPR